MQREIKYRLWDKDLKVMIYPEDDISYEYSLLPSGEVRQQGNGLRNNLVIMLDTGLNDTNGVKIYGGDIVRNLLGKPALVKFGEYSAGGNDYYASTAYGFYVQNFTKGQKREDDHETLSEIHQVLGNIYEHQGLIK